MDEAWQPDPLAPALGGDAPPPKPDDGAPALGGVRGHPPDVVEAVSSILAGARITRRSECVGRHYQTALTLIGLETVLDPEAIEALVAHVLGP